MPVSSTTAASQSPDPFGATDVDTTTVSTAVTALRKP
jgi:hypothetical protein